MSQELWSAVDAYVASTVVHEDDALRAAVESSRAAGLPEIAVSPSLGTLLHLLTRLTGAHRVLEIGTLGGYSTIWMARGLAEGGRLVTLESDPGHASVARANFARAGLDGVIQLREGKALETLPHVPVAPPFDLVFIDADKPNIPAYFEWALRLTRPGSVIVVDNVVRDGALADAASTDAAVQGVRQLHDLLSREPRVTATTIQTVGLKGYDGVLIALVGRP